MKIIWIEDDGGDGYILTIAGKEKIIANSTCSLFQDLYNVTQIENLQLLDASKIVNASYMLAGLRKIAEINLENMDMSNVTNMSYMFYCCNNLTTLVDSMIATKSYDSNIEKGVQI